MKGQHKEQHFLLKLIRIITYYQWSTQSCFSQQWCYLACTIHVPKCTYLSISQRRGKRSRWHLLAKQLPATATIQPCGPGHYQPALQLAFISLAVLKFLPMAGAGWEADPTRCHLPTGKHRELLFRLGNSWNPAKPGPDSEMFVRSGLCLLCSVHRGCKHQSMKEKSHHGTLWTCLCCESAYATFSFSVLARIARKILKWILCTALLFLFLYFFPQTSI